MKKIFYLFLLMNLTHFIYAQDKIFMTDGSKVNAKILEVTPTEIKFKKWQNINGPTFTISKSTVLMLLYQNGQNEIITPNNTTNDKSNTKDGNSSSDPKTTIKEKIIKTGEGDVAIPNATTKEKVNTKVDGGITTPITTIKEKSNTNEGSGVVNQNSTLKVEENITKESNDFGRNIISFGLSPIIALSPNYSGVIAAASISYERISESGKSGIVIPINLSVDYIAAGFDYNFYVAEQHTFRYYFGYGTRFGMLFGLSDNYVSSFVLVNNGIIYSPYKHLALKLNGGIGVFSLADFNGNVDVFPALNFGLNIGFRF